MLTAADRGLDIVPMLEERGVSRRLLEDPQGRVPFAHHVGIVDHITQRLEDPGIGVDMGATANAGDFGVVSLLAESCPTLRQALDVVKRFNALANQASLMDYFVERGRLIIRDAHLRDGRPVPAPLAEATLAFYATMIRGALGVELPLLEVWFAHGRHGAWTPARLAHFGATFRFEQRCNALVLHSDLLDARFRSARPELSPHLHRLAHALEHELTPIDDPVARVSACVRDHLARGELPPIDPVARRLGSSARSLQRELNAAGTSFSAVVDDVRRELAAELLANRDMKLEAISGQLGYSDSRALRRACVRWFGRAPGRARAARSL